MSHDVPTVDLDHARRTFGGVVGLDDLSLAVSAGSVTVMVGPNGAGKTTALRIITGALASQAGRVRVFGLDPSGPDGERVRARCGVVAAKPALYDRLSGRDNLRYGAELFGVEERGLSGRERGRGLSGRERGRGLSGRERWDNAIESCAARFGIEDALDLKVGGYSRGMKTRLALARAILHDPDLLFLDEPTSGLDPESSHAVLALIDELAHGGKTVVMSTHLLLEADGLADQVVMLEDGVDVVAGGPEELVRRYWPLPTVVFDADDRSRLDVLSHLAGVTEYRRNGAEATVTIDGLSRVPELVAALVAAGAQLTRVTPEERSLEQLYLRVRGQRAAREAAPAGAELGRRPGTVDT